MQEYVYLGDMPLAVLTGITTAPMVYYIYTDQIMKPWAVTDVFNQQVWKWDTAPFGEDTASQNPSGLGNFAFNLRFPGQHYDKETGLFYNYFRDYDPQTGRYMQSDPIGLEGGLNTFAYVGGNPVSFADPMGLVCISVEGRMTCAVPNGPAFSVPSPQGQPKLLGPDDWFYHETDVSRDLNGADPECVMKELINNPTPGVPSPASPQGTPSNAVVPWYPRDNFVKSYETKAHGSGIPIVVNTGGVGDGALFGPGYVARYVQGGRVYTKGEGTNGQQSFGPLSDWGNEKLWGEDLDRIIKECKCK